MNLLDLNENNKKTVIKYVLCVKTRKYFSKIRFNQRGAFFFFPTVFMLTCRAVGLNTFVRR